MKSAAFAAVGVLSGDEVPRHHCSASIVDSPNGNVIVTAAHCVDGKKDLFFTPAYQDGQAPYGSWRVLGAYVDDEWKTHHDIDTAGSPYDYAFLVVESHNGKSVADTTGASLHLKTDVRPQNVLVAGYPTKSNPWYKDQLYTCSSPMKYEQRSWMRLQCLGIPGGFSGGPWIAAGTHDLVGLIGGYGQNLPDTDPRNYTVRFDPRVKELYEQAANSPVP